MAGDRVAEIFQVESALEAGREEAAEGRDQGCKDGHDDRMQLERRPSDARHVLEELKSPHQHPQLAFCLCVRRRTRVESGAEMYEGKLKLRQTKTGFGSQETFEKADLPRSLHGQIMYGYRMKSVAHYTTLDQLEAGRRTMDVRGSQR